MQGGGGGGGGHGARRSARGLRLGRAGDDGVPVDAVEGLARGRAHEQHVLVALVDAGLCADEVDPGLGFRVGRGGEVVVPGGREDGEDVGHLLLGVALAGHGGEVRQADLVPELRLGLVAVDGQQVRAQDDVDGLPLLGLACALEDGRALDDPVELEAAVLVYGRHDAGGVCAQGFEAWLVRGGVELHGRRAHGDGLGRGLQAGFGHGDGHGWVGCIQRGCWGDGVCWRWLRTAVCLGVDSNMNPD